MRHRNKTNSLGRKTQHRKAMLANMACSLIEHKRITTTVAKAKALRRYVEPLITKSKEDTTHSRRNVFSNLQNKHAVSELFREVAPKVGDRPGGYTRIIKIGFRPGDAAEMCMIELVDYNDVYITESKESTKKTRRSRRGGGGGKKKSTPEAKQSAPKKQETKKEESKAEDKVEEKEIEAKAEKPEAKVDKKQDPKKEEDTKAEATEQKKPEAKAEEKKEEPKDEEKKEGDNKSE